MLRWSFVFARHLGSPRLIPHQRSVKTKTNNIDDPDAPVVYSTSKASQWKASNTLRPPERIRNMPAIQPYSVAISMTVFMIYFFILREENDIDQLFDRPLQDTIPEVEKTEWAKSRFSIK